MSQRSYSTVDMLVTIPIITAEAECCFSKLERAVTFIRAYSTDE